jgi:hypothetical protein
MAELLQLAACLFRVKEYLIEKRPVPTEEGKISLIKVK